MRLFDLWDQLIDCLMKIMKFFLRQINFQFNDKQSLNCFIVICTMQLIGTWTRPKICPYAGIRRGRGKSIYNSLIEFVYEYRCEKVCAKNNIFPMVTGSAFPATRVYKDTAKIRITVTRASTLLAGRCSPLFVS